MDNLIKPQLSFYKKTKINDENDTNSRSSEILARVNETNKDLVKSRKKIYLKRSCECIAVALTKREQDGSEAQLKIGKKSNAIISDKQRETARCDSESIQSLLKYYI